MYSKAAPRPGRYCRPCNRYHRQDEVCEEQRRSQTLQGMLDVIRR